MTTIVTRAGKGSSLSWGEMDANFTNLNTNKLEAGSAASLIANTPSGTISSTNVQAAINELDTEKATVGSVAAKIDTATLAASSGSSLVGFIQSGTGAVHTTVQSKLYESISVRDFGAVGNGVVDDTAAIQAAIDYAYSIGGADVIMRGTYKTTSTLNLKPFVRLIGEAWSSNSIQNTVPGVTILAVNIPIGYVPSLALGMGIRGLTINGGTQTNNTAIDWSNAKGAFLEQIEVANCTYGLYFNKVDVSGEAYFNEVRSCAFASCYNGIVFSGATNRNTFTSNTYTNCNVAFDFSVSGNVSETNVFINDNVEGCHSWAEWPTGTIYGQTWIGLTVENPTTNGFVCLVKDPGRQLFVGLGIIPFGNPTAVDFYKINSNYSTLLGSKNSSGGNSYGHRMTEQVELYSGLRNKVYYGTTTYTTVGISAGGSATTTITVTDAAVGDLLKLSTNKDLLGCVLAGWVSGTNTVTVRIQNASGGNIALSSVVITAVVEKIG